MNNIVEDIKELIALDERESLSYTVTELCGYKDKREAILAKYERKFEAEKDFIEAGFVYNARMDYWTKKRYYVDLYEDGMAITRDTITRRSKIRLYFGSIPAYHHEFLTLLKLLNI